MAFLQSGQLTQSSPLSTLSALRLPTAPTVAPLPSYTPPQAQKTPVINQPISFTQPPISTLYNPPRPPAPISTPITQTYNPPPVLQPPISSPPSQTYNPPPVFLPGPIQQQVPIQDQTYPIAPPNQMQQPPITQPAPIVPQNLWSQYSGQDNNVQGPGAMPNYGGNQNPVSHDHIGSPNGPGSGAPAPGTSVEQNALNGGGAGNKQQVSNFMQALNNVGAGSNNNQMNGGQPTQGAVSNLVDPMSAYANNGSAGQMTVNPNFSTPVNFGSTNVSGNNAPPRSIDTGQVSQTAPSFYGTATTNPITYAQPAPVASTNAGLNSQTAPSFYGTAAMSDENLKTNINPGNRSVQDFLSAIGAHQYEYKNPELDGQGTFVSPMAQELEKTELGKSAVVDTPRGKMVNYGRLGGINLAASSVLYKEQQKLNRNQERLQAQMDALRKGFKL